MQPGEKSSVVTFVSQPVWLAYWPTNPRIVRPDLVGAKDHPALAGFAQAMANASIETILSSLRDKDLRCRIERSRSGSRRVSAARAL